MKDSAFFRWKLPFGYLLRMITAMFFNLHREFKTDAGMIIRANRIEPKISGRAPAIGPKKTIFLFNHFSSPGFNVMWLAFAIAAVIPVNTKWLMTSAWTFPGRKLHRVYQWVSQIIFMKIARVYGFFPLPPITTKPTDVMEQGIALRSVFTFIRKYPDTVFAIAPEGRDSPNERVGIPPPGAGLFIKTLDDKGFELIPLGFYANQKEIRLNFGNPLHLKISLNLPKEDLDLNIREQVKQAIEASLPSQEHAIINKERT